MNNCKYGHASKKQTLAKTTYVTDPAQEIIDIAFDDVEFEVDLKGDLDVDRVFFFVGTRRFFNKFENSFGFVWAYSCKVKTVILQEQVRNCEWKNFVFAQLSIDFDPIGFRFEQKLFLRMFLIKEPFLIVIS